jgi:predicted molibdopterin-dependent oxidoreductase YjgC
VQNLDVNMPGEIKGKEDQILMKADLAPNRRGALTLGVKPSGGEGQTGEEILEAAVAGEFEILIVVDHDLTQTLGEKAILKLRKHTDYILYLGTHINAMADLADDVIPLAMWAEKCATYTNFQGRVQRSLQPFEPLEFAMPEWEIWKRMAAELGHTFAFETVQDVFNAIGEQAEAFKNLTWDDLGDTGLMLADTPESIYRKVQTPKPLPAY